MLKRWILNIKTTVPGLVAIVAGLGGIAKCIAAHAYSMECIGPSVTSIVTGWGLLNAKDDDVSGGVKIGK